MCMGVLCACVNAGAHRVQKKVSDSLELELQAVVSHQYRCWELKVGPLQDQHVLPIGVTSLALRHILLKEQR